MTVTTIGSRAPRITPATEDSGLAYWGSAANLAATTFDMTALTEEGAVYSAAHGFTGADWIYWAQANGTPRSKTQGGAQLTQTTISGATQGSNSLKAVAWNATEEVNAAPSGTSSPNSRVYNCSVGNYIEWSGIIADCRTRVLHWRGQSSACGSLGTFQVTALLGDASAAMTPFNLSGGVCGFGLTFCALRPPANATNLTVRITCTASPAGPGNSFLFSQLAWLEVPLALAIPRGARRSFLNHGLGGPLA